MACLDDHTATLYRTAKRVRMQHGDGIPPRTPPLGTAIEEIDTRIATTAGEEVVVKLSTNKCHVLS